MPALTIGTKPLDLDSGGAIRVGRAGKVMGDGFTQIEGLRVMRGWKYRRELWEMAKQVEIDAMISRKLTNLNRSFKFWPWRLKYVQAFSW